MGEYSLGDALKQFLNKSRIKSSVQAMQIEEAWEQIMGKTIARYTEKIQIHGNTLYITTHMAPLKQELLFQKENIIKRVNESLGERTIKEVVII
jgi:predicted nucleic acid-binding Zn ribbon protein